MTNFEKVKEFHKVFRLILKDRPEVPDRPAVMLRKRLIDEEHKELMLEIEDYIKTGDVEEVNLPNLAKELADVLYTCYGMACEFGIDIDAVFDAVHESNLSKLDEHGNPVHDAQGKVIKSERYRAPNIKKVLEGAN